MHTYTSIAAQHFAAYRLPLHAPIVHKALDGMHFSKALDVGCGTGSSTLALLPYCDDVMGLNPSAEMIASASPHPRIDYRTGIATNLPVSDHNLDVVSIAGALPYIDIDLFAAELRRAWFPSTKILVYDFWVDLQDLIQRTGLPLTRRVDGYANSMSLSGVAGFGKTIESMGNPPAN